MIFLLLNITSTSLPASSGMLLLYDTKSHFSKSLENAMDAVHPLISPMLCHVAREV